MTNDYPDVEYVVAELPAGPGGQGHPAVHELLGHGRRQPQPGGRARPGRVPDQHRAAARVLAGVRRRCRRSSRPPSSGRATTRTSPRSWRVPTTPRAFPTYDGTADVITDFNSQLAGPEDRRSAGDPRLRPVEPRGDRRLRRSSHDCDRNGASPRRNTRRGSGAARRSPGGCSRLPVILILGVFLLIPVVMALWVSVSDWSGRGSPFSSERRLRRAARTTPPSPRAAAWPTRDFGIAMRNNTWYVLLVVPLQTALSLFLAVLVNGAILRGRGFFRTAFYFPSVTSSVAITVLLLFLFSTTGVVNEILGASRHQRTQLVHRSAGHPPHPRRQRGHHRRARRRSPAATSSGCRGGTGSPGRRSR